MYEPKLETKFSVESGPREKITVRRIRKKQRRELRERKRARKERQEAAEERKKAAEEAAAMRPAAMESERARGAIQYSPENGPKNVPKISNCSNSYFLNFFSCTF